MAGGTEMKEKTVPKRNTENGIKKEKKLKTFVKKHKVLSIIIALVLVAALITGGLALKGGRSSEISYSFIRTTTLAKGTIEDTVTATGTVSSAKTSNVTTALNYTVASINVAVGDTVKKGDVICTLSTDELEAQIEKEEKNLAKAVSSAKASYNSAKTQYSNAKTEYETYDSTYESAESAYQTAKKPYDNAVKSLSSTQSAYDTALKAYNKAGAAYVSALADYNTAVSKYKSGSIGKAKLISTAKAYLQAVQDYYGKCTKGSYDISDTSTQNAAAGMNNTGTQQSGGSVTVTQSASDLCNAVIRNIKTLTGTTLTTPSGSNRLYKLYQKAQALRSAKSLCNYDTLESDYTASKEVFEQAKQTRKQYKEALSQAKEQLSKAKEELENASASDTLDDLKSQLEDCSLKAEQSGTVTALNATVGSICKESVATVQDLNSLQVDITVEEADINNVELGMVCRITSDASDNTFSGTLTQIDPVSENGSFGATVTVKEQTDELHIGMNASVDIIVSSNADVYQVPLDAVGDDNGTSFVYRKTGGEGTDMQFEKITVTTGESNDYYIEIASEELSEGDVIRSSADLSEGVETVSSGSDSDSKSGGLFSGLFGGSGGMSGPPSGGNVPSGDFPSPSGSSKSSSGGMGTPPSGGMPGGSNG